MIYIRKLMDTGDLTSLQSMMNSAEWVDGLLTTTNGSTQIKSNIEVAQSYSNYQQMRKLVYDSLDMDTSFIRKTSAKSTGIPLFSRTEEGGYYKPHQDNFVLGHYSTTLFLNNPDEYEGGYLRLFDDEVREYKLDAGYAITYSTGIPHEVSEVISGHRDVAVMWTHSHFSPDYVPVMYHQIQDLLNIISKTHTSSPSNIEEAVKDPLFIAETLKSNFQRIFMDN